jgi:nucleotide-binding universal stress UspA family protein
LSVLAGAGSGRNARRLFLDFRDASTTTFRIEDPWFKRAEDEAEEAGVRQVLPDRCTEAEVFRRILVALDGSEDARAAFVFVSDWTRHFDAKVWFIQLADESSRRRCEIVTDVQRRGRQMTNQFTVSGATRGARNQRLVGGISEAAVTFGADLIVVGLDRHRLARSGFSRNVREQLTAATNIPVLMAPKRTVVRVPATTRREWAIPLGPGRALPVMAGAAMAHV